MNEHCYLFVSKKGEVTIAPNEDWPSRWVLRVNGKAVRLDYRDPEEASYFASRRDFGDEELEQIYIGLRVPAELDKWTLCKLSEIEI